MKKLYKRKKNKIINILDTTVCLHSFINKTNIITTLTDLNGHVFCWFSSGTIGLRGFKKGTPIAAQKLAMHIEDKCKKINVKKIILMTKGCGSTKTIFIRSLLETSLNIIKCVDITSFAFNGCRAKKRRKV